MTPFHDLAEFMAIPRVEALRLSPDGRRLVAVVRALSPDRKKYLTALWEIDPGGEAPPRRLTRSAKGESSPVVPPGRHAAVSLRRPDSQAPEDEEEHTALWALPAAGGEAEPVAVRAGITAPVTARDAGTIAFVAATLPGDEAADQDRRKKRADAGVTAILHEGYPIRSWDHELGPDEPRLFVLAEAGAGRARTGAARPATTRSRGRRTPGRTRTEPRSPPWARATSLPTPGWRWPTRRRY